jgi:uncharacterized membrane protein
LRAFTEATRRYFIAGLLAFAPIGVTIWAISWIIQRLDNLLLPRFIAWVSPGADAPPSVPPLIGAIFTFGVILLAGVVVRHFFGHEAIRLWERLLRRVPVASSIYVAVKQLVEALLSSSTGTESFRRVVLIEYPRRGVYAIGFVTGPASEPVQQAVGEEPLLNCFVPTTPNPTSGFYLLVPSADVVELEITVEEAFKVVMSAGLVTPEIPGRVELPAGVAAPADRAPRTELES